MSESTGPNRRKRVLATLELLREHPEGVPNSKDANGIFELVTTKVPLSSDEAVVNASNLVRGYASLSFDSVGLVGAGWITKQDGIWRITQAGRQALKEFPDADALGTQMSKLNAVRTKLRKENRAEQLRTVLVARSTSEEVFRDVASLFVERGFKEASSVFDPERSVWTSDALAELRKAFIEAPEYVGGQFHEKLQKQLAGVSDDAKLLMAEVLAWQMLPLSKDSMGWAKKEYLVDSVLSGMTVPATISPEVAKGFRNGVVNPGPRMTRDKPRAVTLILTLLENWVALDPEEQQLLLTDPWQWRTFVLGVKGSSFPTQRNALLFMVHPETFTNIFSDADKGLIRNAFIGAGADSTGDVDKDLFNISLRLQQDSVSHVDFYDVHYQPLWKKGTAAPSDSNLGDEDDVDAEEEVDVEVALQVELAMPFPSADEALSGRVFIDERWLQDSLNLLESKRQMILYGPPGTGKTFVALALAEHIARDEAELVQFHPSYTYEDFFQGYRPVTVNGALSYELRDGPLRRIVDKANKAKHRNFVLVIDEINRGNLAKIFGELYFLLEYRHRKISLQYSAESFELPDNLFIIGTMNTSDRSIALMDAAMRRRFAFRELHPAHEPVSRVLSAWLDAHQHNQLGQEPAELLRHLNAKIKDPAFSIGPSYLMPLRVGLTHDVLERIWSSEILPLLEEHHYGEGKDVLKQYQLVTLRTEISSARVADNMAGGDAAPADTV